MYCKPLKIDEYTVYYDNKAAAQQTIHEIFHEQGYVFQASTLTPLIIDAGSNIGIATLFFKKCYPKAKILCFEPDPVAFEILQKNVSMNQLHDVTLYNLALSNRFGKVKFYGQVDVKTPDTRGNSILPGWGLQRPTSCCIEVDATCLSRYIQEPVDLLKLDIEGAEQIVLQELGDKLELVKEIVLEIHEVDVIQPWNHLKTIVQLLEQKHFNVTVIKKTIDCFPKAVQSWVKNNQPQLYYMRAFKPYL